MREDAPIMQQNVYLVSSFMKNNNMTLTPVENPTPDQL